MSIFTIPTEETTWQGIGPVEGLRLGSGVLTQSIEFASLKQSENQAAELTFIGRIALQGLPPLPEQRFRLRFLKDGFVIEGHPTDSWPQLEVVCETTPSAKDFVVREFAFRLVDSTVDAWLRHTRVIWSLGKVGGFDVETLDLGQVFEVRCEVSTEGEHRLVRQMARMVRKLRYIENVFQVKFSVPDRFSPEEVLLVEMIYRGITEGDFVRRGPDYTFLKVSGLDIDFSNRPFDRPGPFSRGIAPTLNLLGYQIPVGPITVSLENAALSSATVVEQLRNRPAEPADLRFEVLDNQIRYRFEAYADQPRSRRMERLNRFKYELAREEPPELVDLLDESLQNDVLSKEASQIAGGWTQYNDLPDGYCPQEPELDATTRQWHVPIYLVHSSGEGGPVGEVVIDEKTGIIVSHTPVDELRSKGRALAEQIVHV